MPLVLAMDCITCRMLDELNVGGRVCPFGLFNELDKIMALVLPYLRLLDEEQILRLWWT